MTYFHFAFYPFEVEFNFIYQQYKPIIALVLLQIVSYIADNRNHFEP